MILIADSGSTKCDWVLLRKGETPVEFSTMGFNPYFHDEATIAAALRAEPLLSSHADQARHVFFYGAGASSPGLSAIVRRALVSVFPNAECHVSHDLDGAALATYDGEPHIACILGTGSNSCFFDGREVHEEVPALAYILGDEGSGSYYGKRLLADFLYRRMPEDLYIDFRDTYHLTKESIMKNVYMKPHANVYLASFMRFCSQHKEHAYIRDMVSRGMKDFLETHVCCFANHKEVPVSFVGSVAYYFEDQLRQEAAALGIRVHRVVKKPIHGLVDYHRKFTFSGVQEEG